MSSSYFKTKSKDSGKTVYDQGLKFKEGQIIKIHYTDEDTNLSKKYVEYDVVARDARGGTVTYKNCRYAGDISGINDFSETILEANEIALQGKLDPSNFAANMNGTFVLLGFLDGNIDKPIIMGGFSHRKNSGAKKSEGVRKKRKFRGVQVEINKDGEYIFTQQGPNKPDGTRSTTETDTTVKFDKNGNINIKQKDGLTVDLHGKNDKVTFKTKGGLKVEYDGKSDKATYTTAGGPKVTIDGAGTIKLEANATQIIIDGNSGKISLTGNLVDVGAAASALAALGPQLVAWLASHVHMGDGPSIPPAPTSPPLVPPPASVLSTTVKIKA